LGFSRRESRNREAAFASVEKLPPALVSVGANLEIVRRRARRLCGSQSPSFSRRESRNREAAQFEVKFLPVHQVSVGANLEIVRRQQVGSNARQAAECQSARI